MPIFDIIVYYISYLIFPFIILLGYFFYIKKDRKEKIAASILLIISLVFIYARFIEPKLLLVKYNQLEINNSNPLGIKIAILADIHSGIYKHTVSLKRVVQKINKINPDITFIPGDFIYRIKKENIEKELVQLSNINSPVYAVTGNHDTGNPEPDLRVEIGSALRKYGVILMDNKTETIEIKGEKITIIGLIDLWTGEANFNLLKNLSEEENVIVMAHNPDTVYEFPKNIANIDLVISGHTHGGQIRLPVLYKYAIPTAYPSDKGLHNINNTKVYVTPGIGLTGLPFRFLMPPQIDVLEI